MRKSAGILFIHQKKALLCHPSKAKWTNTFGPPKGGIESGETPLEAAIRECKEEASIDVPVDLVDINLFTHIDYKTKAGKTFKKVTLFIVHLDSLDQIGLNNHVIEKDRLQIEEVDWCGFLSKEELEGKVFWRFKDLIYEHLS